jgi:6-phosphogluconolactonase
MSTPFKRGVFRAMLGLCLSSAGLSPAAESSTSDRQTEKTMDRTFYVADCAAAGGIRLFDAGADGAIREIASYPAPDINYLLISPAGDRLWATGKTGIFTFRRHADGTLELMNVFAPGGGGCHLALDPNGTTLYTVNYGEGFVAEFRLADGVPVERTRQIVHTGKTGPVVKRQNKPHTHCTVISPDGEFLAVADLGIDCVRFYRRQAAGGLEASPAVEFTARPGTGPRHLVFQPDGKTFYLLGELANTVTVGRRDGDAFTEIQHISTLPADFTAPSFAAAIRRSPDGKFLFVSNRGHNSIAAYRIEADGRLTPEAVTAVEGHYPRDFNFLPGGNQLAAANEGGSVTVFDCDAATGKLTCSPITLTGMTRPLAVTSVEFP